MLMMVNGSLHRSMTHCKFTVGHGGVQYVECWKVSYISRSHMVLLMFVNSHPL